ncbi:uncharacterized protein LOC111715063 [Eurytemora carolleeae]|uniref:uncharacterized protein LOC111715063 n=1 Tax=Eurytemora carolleeae TaxID=1294199 RepID=UPI000C7786A9|nr:uncharacterized protein LOC111715063 [Eurytemora carolleeae]XP_023346077.1 uncharacterized protein LOC111715063 [Eurytemora carolleeae]|eukprot:XP_023346076.1 uncharacterized protein LOC111715063 [Eurytemora affinis]
MPRAAISQKHLAAEIARCLEDNELDEFRAQVLAAEDIDYDLNTQYGKEVGYKTILHLAIDEDDHDTLEYIDILLQAGASARYQNPQLQSSPIHVAADEGKLGAIQLLLKYPENKADVNAVNRYGLTGLHILLAQLLDLAFLQTKPKESRPGKIADDSLEKDIADILEAITLILKQRELYLNFDEATDISDPKLLNKQSYKKLATMTPLQILCSFQTWNARPISMVLHRKLEECVLTLLRKDVDPNATSAKNSVAGSIAGSTPPVLLAAIRGYFLVVEVFKQFNTDFLVENKFQQSILHVVLKAGYYNKILVHGEECGVVNEKTIYCLFKENSIRLKYSMMAIINRADSYGNTPLHYAKQYPTQEITKFLLRNGAKIDRNPQGTMNIHPKVLEEFLFEDCMLSSGDDADDEDFGITILFNIFAQPDIDPQLKINKVEDKAIAWSDEVEKGVGKRETRKFKKKIDTKRLEFFGDVDTFRQLLKHPVLSSFLELQLNNLRTGYIIDFLVYLLYILILYVFFGERFNKLKSKLSTTVEVYYVTQLDYSITISTILVAIFTIFLMAREIVQLVRLRKRYFHYYENMIEWCVLVLVLLSLLPDIWFISYPYLQKHLAAFTFLLAFMQVYLLLVRIVPNTPIPLYVNMFSTVLRTYTFILLSYFAFLVSFAFSFSLVYSAEPCIVSANSTDTTACEENADDQFGNLGYALVKTVVMFTGEFNYNDFPIRHWLGYLLFIMFVFLMTVVLMNLLNGLAVSDIHKIQKEVDTYYQISIVETLAYSKFVTLLAESIVIRPNMKPDSPRLLGVEVPGQPRYQVKADSMKDYYLNESTVKAAKDLVVDWKANASSGKLVTLEDVGEDLNNIRKEQGAMKSRLGTIEESISLILDIMQSRQPTVHRI